MNSTTRTFRARYQITLDTAVLSAHDYLLEITGYGDSIQITLDGQRCSKAVAKAITRLALNLGTFERLSGPSLDKPVIGSKAASTLHRDLARLGYTRNGSHLQTATEALERPVSSLATLSAEEAQTVYGYACAQQGMSSRVWAA